MGDIPSPPTPAMLALPIPSQLRETLTLPVRLARLEHTLPPRPPPALPAPLAVLPALTPPPARAVVRSTGSPRTPALPAPLVLTLPVGLPHALPALLVVPPALTPPPVRHAMRGMASPPPPALNALPTPSRQEALMPVRPALVPHILLLVPRPALAALLGVQPALTLLLALVVMRSSALPPMPVLPALLALSLLVGLPPLVQPAPLSALLAPLQPSVRVVLLEAALGLISAPSVLLTPTRQEALIHVLRARVDSFLPQVQVLALPATLTARPAMLLVRVTVIPVTQCSY